MLTDVIVKSKNKQRKQEQIKFSERIDQIVTSAPTEKKEDQQHWQNFPVRNEYL